MRKGTIWLMVTMTAVLMMTGCGNKASKEQCERANQLVESAQRARNYSQLMQLTDSLENEGSLTPAKACYWRGYASDRMNKKRMAEFYWKTSLEAATDEEMDIYAKSASRLANLLTVRGEYKTALESAIPAAKRLEDLKCDSTSDYINLLIYIGCCQAGLGTDGEATSDGFDRAYKKHIENIENNHTDAAYKDAIAGLINIAYACNTTKKYREANDWITKFGELLNQYQQRPGTDANYVDKQVARFNIYQAIMLNGLGKEEEARKVYDEYQETEYSKTPEGRITANDYLTAANRWEEAAVNYRSLDAILDNQQAGYSIDDIENQVLKKYQANLKAGRRDSAIAVSMQISDALGKALAREKQIYAEEQSTIVREVEDMIANQAKEDHQRQLGMWGVIGVLLLCFLGYALYRRYSNQQLKVAHENLKADYGQLEELTAAKERRATEIRISHQLQDDMLPKVLPSPDGLVLDTLFVQGTGIGSDLYDGFESDGKFVFCIGSTKEKDAVSAIAANRVLTLFRTTAPSASDPAAIITAINEAMTRKNDCRKAVALFVGIIDPSTGLLTYCNAGNTTPLQLGEEVSLLPSDENSPVGIDGASYYTSQQTELAKGSKLFVYTDGLALSENGEGKQIGEKKVRGAALQSLKLNPQPKAFIQNMREAIATYTGGTPQTNDITMILIAT